VRARRQRWAIRRGQFLVAAPPVAAWVSRTRRAL
jgi:hypothetical protein